jgi:hypothetical protein
MDLMNGSLQLYLPPFGFQLLHQLLKLLRRLLKLLRWLLRIKADLLVRAASVPAESSETEPEEASLSGYCFHLPAAYLLHHPAVPIRLALLHREFLEECHVCALTFTIGASHILDLIDLVQTPLLRQSRSQVLAFLASVLATMLGQG